MEKTIIKNLILKNSGRVKIDTNGISSDFEIKYTIKDSTLQIEEKEHLVHLMFQ